jgi:hypothetical protein
MGEWEKLEEKILQRVVRTMVKEREVSTTNWKPLRMVWSVKKEVSVAQCPWNHILV